jgi:hypothetical protein
VHDDDPVFHALQKCEENVRRTKYSNLTATE